jgi:proline racemase
MGLAMSQSDVRAVDYHTGGEPFRIVAEPPVTIAGGAVADRRIFAISDPAVDGLRRMLCFEPRGHADMYGGFIAPPEGNPYQRNVTIFADGEVDRSPCGSGAASRVAVLSAAGRLGDDRLLVHDSIVGSRFHARVLRHVSADGRPAVIPVVSGSAHKTGEHLFVADPVDELFPGFVLR